MTISCPKCGEHFVPARLSLTQQQKKTLSYIKNYMKRRGVAPSYQEINDAMGLHSKSGVARLVDCPVERGYLLKPRYRPRSMIVVDAQ